MPLSERSQHKRQVGMFRRPHYYSLNKGWINAPKCSHPTSHCSQFRAGSSLKGSFWGGFAESKAGGFVLPPWLVTSKQCLPDPVTPEWILPSIKRGTFGLWWKTHYQREKEERFHSVKSVAFANVNFSGKVHREWSKVLQIQSKEANKKLGLNCSLFWMFAPLRLPRGHY